MKFFNDEITDSVKTTLKKRMNSSIYGTFVIYWVIFHWNLFFTIFFVSEDKIWNSMSLFKNDYIVKTFFDYHSVWFYLEWVLPIIFTLLTIWVFPRYIVIPAFKKEEEDETEKTIFKLEQERMVVQAKTQLETEKLKETAAIAKKVEEEQKIVDADPTIIWDRDYNNFESGGYFKNYLYFLNNLYAGNKYLSDFIPSDVSYFDALGLLEIGGGQINGLTPKGKHFALKSRSKI